MINNKLKYLLFGILILFFIGVINHYSVCKLELLGHYSKVGAHRVNSIEKLESAVKYFEIIELDLVYDEVNDLMDVNHPPTESINLKLADYLSGIKGSQKPFLWLDMKNITKRNSAGVLNSLLKELTKINYPLSRVLIETQSSEVLTAFVKAGFKTSYYLPYGLCRMGATELRESVGSIREILKKQPSIAISSDIQDYEILAENFPSVIKYTWATGSVFRNHFIQTQKALRDPNVAVVLVTYKAPEGNR